MSRSVELRGRFDTLDFEQLFAAALQQEAGALDEFCRRVRPGLIQIATFRVYEITREEAEDLAHESLVVFVGKYQEVTTSPTAFLRSILYNLIGNFLRRRFTSRSNSGNGSTARTTGETHTDGKSNESYVENRDLLERAERAISAMDEPCKTLLIGLIEGYEVKELWQRMQELEPGLKRAAFDRRIYVCRRRLWNLLGVQL